MKNKDFAALNVTIPYKKAVIPYLEELDERARRIGAVNTIVNDHGRLIGKNTDYYGCRFMLEQAGMEIQGRKVILLGNGGAAQAVQAVLEDLGAAAIVKVKRNPFAGNTDLRRSVPRSQRRAGHRQYQPGRHVSGTRKAFPWSWIASISWKASRM